MNKIYKLIFAALAVLTLTFATSCEKSEEIPVTYLEVNATNLHGNWMLTSIGGQPLKEGTYFYINFDRSGNKFKIWETLTSIPSSPNIDEGTFSLGTDPETGAYIRGIDTALEEWSDYYSVKDLTSDSMTWVGVNDPSFVQTFKRVDKVPVAKE